jgi:hypothetical protein
MSFRHRLRRLHSTDQRQLEMLNLHFSQPSKFFFFFIIIIIGRSLYTDEVTRTLIKTPKTAKPSSYFVASENDPYLVL